MENESLERMFRRYFSKEKTVGKQGDMLCFNDMDIQECLINPDKASVECPSIQDIEVYLSGHSTSDDEGRIRIHIQKCATCKEMVRQGKEALQKNKNGTLENAPEDIAKSIDCCQIIRDMDKK